MARGGRGRGGALNVVQQLALMKCAHADHQREYIW